MAVVWLWEPVSALSKMMKKAYGQHTVKAPDSTLEVCHSLSKSTHILQFSSKFYFNAVVSGKGKLYSNYVYHNWDINES